MPEWTARRILRELAPAEARRDILADLWRFGDAPTKLGAQAFLAKALHFRDVSIKKMPPEKKAELLASRAGLPDAEPYLGSALMLHHMHHKAELMAAFLDQWKIPHENGQIVQDEVAAPEPGAVRDAVAALGDRFASDDVRLYLATAGLLMGDDWRAALWPVADEMPPATA